MSSKDCPFCIPNSKRIFLSNTLCRARWDRNPVNEGHVLIVPVRHFADYFDATDDEKRSLWEMLEKAKELIADKYKPDGFNIGVNVGEAAGQSVFHVHIHLIPRYEGDVPDPKGGVRSVLPHKQKY